MTGINPCFFSSRDSIRITIADASFCYVSVPTFDSFSPSEWIKNHSPFQYSSSSPFLSFPLHLFSISFSRHLSLPDRHSPTIQFISLRIQKKGESWKKGYKLSQEYATRILKEGKKKKERKVEEREISRWKERERNMTRETSSSKMWYKQLSAVTEPILFFFPFFLIFFLSRFFPIQGLFYPLSGWLIPLPSFLTLSLLFLIEVHEWTCQVSKEEKSNKFFFHHFSNCFLSLYSLSLSPW